MTAEIKRRVVETLQVHEGQTVADVGCGDGFYTIPLARALGPAGKVLAVDIDEAALSKLKQRLAEEGITSVEAIKGKTDDPLLPLNGLDAVRRQRVPRHDNARGDAPAHSQFLKTWR